jgi:hypothetical protein
MKNIQVKVGERVVVNSLKDATVYRIAELSDQNKFAVRLEYEAGAGRAACGGWIDKSLLRQPTAEQLKNAGI